MALVKRHYVSFNLIDGVKRSCGNTFYISEAAAEAWINAVDQAARDATLVGTLRTQYLIQTEAEEVDTTVSVEVYQDTVPPVTDDILRGNKLKFYVQGGGVNRDFDVPARDSDNFDQSPDSLDVSITTNADMIAFVAAYNAVVLDAFGNARHITGAKIVD